MNKEMINEIDRKYRMDGIIKDTICSSEERPVSTFLGSTDRKGYTVKTVCLWMDERFETYVDFQPYEKQEDIKNAIEKIQEESKYMLAERVYKKHFQSNE